MKNLKYLLQFLVWVFLSGLLLMIFTSGLGESTGTNSDLWIRNACFLGAITISKFLSKTLVKVDNKNINKYINIVFWVIFWIILLYLITFILWKSNYIANLLERLPHNK